MSSRHEFIMLLGSAAAAWPLVVRAQQSSPVVGYLAHGRPEGGAALVTAVRKGLGEAGLAEGKNFTSQFRWASNNADRLPGLAIDLIQRRVAVIITLGTVAAARAAKAATTEIPIVFAVGSDPVQASLVTSLNHPGGNVTGISTMKLDIGSKWVGLMHELLPAAKSFAVLINLSDADSARSLITGTQKAKMSAHSTSRQVHHRLEFASGPRSSNSQGLRRIDAAHSGDDGKFGVLQVASCPAVSCIEGFWMIAN
jgi:putative tryptophan/tyrosine transport system substrate-binding protein